MPGATDDIEVAAKPGTHRAESAAKLGTVVSAIVASSCCWAPPLLLLFGVSSVGMVAALEAYRPILMVVTFSFLGAAFYFTYRPRRSASEQEDCCAPAASGRRFNMMSMNKIMLWCVTAMAVVFLFFPQLVTDMLAPESGDFTSEMHRMTLTVEGMTCPG